MEWKQGADAHHVSCATPFVKFFVAVDYLHTAGPLAIRYEADVLSGNGTNLATTDNLPSLDAAQAWCVEQYRTLLEAELRRL